MSTVAARTGAPQSPKPALQLSAHWPLPQNDVPLIPAGQALLQSPQVIAETPAARPTGNVRGSGAGAATSGSILFTNGTICP